jgi:hypothetical protein
MLKSTYKPSAGAAAAAATLPPGWTQHTAPSGHTYYYHAETKASTYQRPGVQLDAAAQTAPAAMPTPQLQLSDPRVANAFMAQYERPQATRGGMGPGHRGSRGGGESRPRPQPVDQPRSKVAIPGCEPWLLVYTKYGRRFAYNPAKNASYWRIPDKLKAGILELDQARIWSKAEGEGPDQPEGASTAAKPVITKDDQAALGEAYDSSEYEEVEVTDDEDDENPSKRQRTDDPADDDQPVEFDEADIAYQLQAMQEGFGEEEEDYQDADGADQAAALSEEDAKELFFDLLDDFRINPYSPWEKLIEEGKVFEDPRYTALHTTKARKEAWEQWSRQRIARLKEERAREQKKDPRIPYFEFLQLKATPKLYWPEFKRKYRKEIPMKDGALSDKDREKWYREYISRLKLGPSTTKSDLTALLKSVPLSKLNNKTIPTHLPPEITTDMRYIAMDATLREPLVEGYIQTLGPPPEDVGAVEEDEAKRKANESRRRREQALLQREKAVAEEKRRLERMLRQGKAALREEERELEAAMHVGKRGLQTQLADSATAGAK